MVKIRFSRHAKRRAKLYKIAETTIIDILTHNNLPQGKNEIIKDIIGLKYPLKIVFVRKKDLILVITNYPLKKGRSK